MMNDYNLIILNTKKDIKMFNKMALVSSLFAMTTVFGARVAD